MREKRKEIRDRSVGNSLFMRRKRKKILLGDSRKLKGEDVFESKLLVTYVK